MFGAVTSLLVRFGPKIFKAATEVLALKEIWDWIRGGDSAAPAPATATPEVHQRLALLGDELLADQADVETSREDVTDEWDQLEAELSAFECFEEV